MTCELTTNRLQQILHKIEKNKTTHGKKFSSVFWVSDDKQHRKQFQKTGGNCCFNQQIGLPTSKIEPFGDLSLFGYELDIIENITNYKDYALNKARGIGATELILRWIVFKAVHNKIPGRKFLVITAIGQELTKDYMRRIMELCDKIPTKRKAENKLQINKSQIIAIPANPSAIRGYENVEVIFADEAAHWDLLDDDPVLQAIEPHRTKSDAHVILVSTPNGRRGFFAKIFHSSGTKYYKDVKSWHVSEGLLIRREEVEKIKKEDYYRYEQEYNCQFLTSKYSAFPAAVLAAAEQNSEEYQLVD